MPGASLLHKAEIEAFAEREYGNRPWLKDVAALAWDRLNRQSGMQ